MSNDNMQEKRRASAREEKRAQFAEGGGKGGSLKLAVVILALAAVAGYVVFAALRDDEGARPTPAADVKPAAAAEGDAEVRVPLKDLEGGKAVFFEPRLSGGKTARFFVVKAADNTYRAALDACEVCFHAKKGYEQKGSDMICRNCGRGFAIADIGPHNEDGCHPIAIKHAVEGDSLVVKTGELEKRASYF